MGAGGGTICSVKMIGSLAIGPRHLHPPQSFGVEFSLLFGVIFHGPAGPVARFVARPASVVAESQAHVMVSAQGSLCGTSSLIFEAMAAVVASLAIAYGG
jgi:hypothetical protein